MASPHVAGAAALLLSAQPSATPAAVRDAMVRGATQNVVGDPMNSPNLLLNVASGVTPSAPSAPPQDVTPITAPQPVTRAPGSNAGGNRRALARPSTPRLLAAKRTSGGVKLSISGKGSGYEVIINGKSVGRTTSTAPIIRTKAARSGAQVRVRAYNDAGTSAPSNAIRL
mgnify:CR=1 FL=1